MLLACLDCGTRLTLVLGDSYLCETCEKSYPIVNEVPVLVNDPNSFLAKTFLHNENTIWSQNNNVRHLDRVMDPKHRRPEILTRIKNGLLQNLEYHDKLKKALSPFVTKEEIISIIQNKESIAFYHNTLDYLKKDWCWREEEERALELVFKTLANFVTKYSELSNENVLVLGAGCGRTAWDLRKIFDDVYALDLSFCLVSYFYTLLNENIRFNEIFDKNVYSMQDIVVSHEASLCAPGTVRKIEDGGFNFFVGDATRVFLPAESMEVVASIYFSDVIPFRSLLHEAKRVLKAGGLLIHFGPLGYHFSDPKNNFSAEEIKEILEHEGFAIMEETFVTAPHTFSNSSLASQQTFNNWSFVARKTTANS